MFVRCYEIINNDILDLKDIDSDQYKVHYVNISNIVDLLDLDPIGGPYYEGSAVVKTVTGDLFFTLDLKKVLSHFYLEF